MKKIRLLLAFALILFIALIGGALQVSAEASHHIRVIIGFKDHVDPSIVDNIPDADIYHFHDAIDAITVSVPEDEIPILRSHPDVAWVEVDQDVSISATGPAQMVNWGYEKTIDINTVKLNITGNGVKIGIIDTGISVDHPDLKVAGGISVVPGITSYHDDHGHGTHVAGIIGAQDNGFGALGIAPNVELYAIKALNQDGRGSQADVVAGIEWAIENELDILNLSLTNPMPSLALKRITEKAAEAGIILVAASGNLDEITTYRSDIMYPARYEHVIGVGSVGKDLSKSSFSYRGPSLEYVAPGEQIYSTVLSPTDKRNGYGYMSGTSMAAPFVAGIAALYKEVYPDLDTAQLKQIMANQAIDLGVPGRDPIFGFGLIQSPETLFWDVPKEMWYTNAVMYLKQQNHISGYPDGSFKPNGPITRGEAVKMIGNALGLDGTPQPTPYQDVKENYFASGYIVEGTKQGWITGYPNREFKPNDPIKRGDVALMIQRAFKISPSNRQAFQDVKESDYYYAAINGLYESDLITGYETGLYKPQQTISRAEFSMILSKVLDMTYR